MENLKLRVRVFTYLIIFITWFQATWKKVKDITRKIAKFIFNHPIKLLILTCVLFTFVLLIIFQTDFLNDFISPFKSILINIKECLTINSGDTEKIYANILDIAGLFAITSLIETSLKNSKDEFYGMSLDKISLWEKRWITNIFMLLSLLSPLLIVSIVIFKYKLILFVFSIAIFFVNVLLCCRTIWIQRDFIKKQKLVIKKIRKIVIRYIAELYERKNDKIQYDQYHDYTYFHDIVSTIALSKDDFSVSVNLFLINIHKSVNDFLFSLITLKENPIIKLFFKSESLKKIYNVCIPKAALFLNCMMIENISKNLKNVKETYAISVFNDIKRNLNEDENSEIIKQDISDEELTLYFSCISGLIMGLLLSESYIELDKLLESVFCPDITDEASYVYPVYIKEICSVLVVKILEEKYINISSLTNYWVVYNYNILASCKFKNAKQKYYISNEKSIDIRFINFIISVCKEIIDYKK